MERSFFVFPLCYLVVYIHYRLGIKREGRKKKKKEEEGSLGLNLEKHGGFDLGKSDVNSLCIKSVWLVFV